MDGDTLTVESVTQGANGAVTNNGSNVTYTPDADYCGIDSFAYTVSDGKGGSDTDRTASPVLMSSYIIFKLFDDELLFRN